MTSNGWLQIALFGVIVIVITRPFGGYMTRVFASERTFLSPLLARSSAVAGSLYGVYAVPM
jgi:K+-transporting ATPase ATPase A chain